MEKGEVRRRVGRRRGIGKGIGEREREGVVLVRW